MFNPEYDPMQVLEQLQVTSMSHEQGLDELSEHVRQQAHLLEMMAKQVKHLTNAVIGLQHQNKMLIHRVNKLDGVDLD